MPKLNSRGDWWCSGVGGSGAYVNGQQLAAEAGGTGWFSDDRVIFQNCSGGRCRLETHDIVTGQRDEVAPRGANHITAGGGVWAAWLGGFGIYDSLGRHFPNSGLGVAGPDGAYAIKNVYHSYGPWDVIERDGSRWRLTDGDAHDIQLLGAGRAHWRDGQLRTRNIPLPNLLPGAVWWLKAVEIRGEWWWLYQSEAAGGSLVLHPTAGPTGYRLTAPGSLSYRPDVVALPNGRLRVVWASREDEHPSVVHAADVDLATPRVDLWSPKPEPPKPPPVSEPVKIPNYKSVVERVRKQFPAGPMDKPTQGAFLVALVREINKENPPLKAGLHLKSGSNSYPIPGTSKTVDGDLVVFSDGHMFDVLGKEETESTAAWNDEGISSKGSAAFYDVLADVGDAPSEPEPPKPEPPKEDPRIPILQAEIAALKLRIEELENRPEPPAPEVPEFEIVSDPNGVAIPTSRDWAHAHVIRVRLVRK